MISRWAEAFRVRGDARSRQEWRALVPLCLGVLMISLNSTAISVALPTIASDLSISEVTLVWIANAYVAAFGGTLLLGSRLGDVFDSWRLFFGSIALYMFASVLCGVATVPTALLASRILQGISGAVVWALALATLLQLFVVPAARARALGVHTFVTFAGSSSGLLLGGALTSMLGWRWAFFVNIPVGLVVLALYFLKPVKPMLAGSAHQLDFAGAISFTASLMLLGFALAVGSSTGWFATRTLALLATALTLLVIFIAIERRGREPVIPLHVFRSRAFTLASAAGALLAGAVLGWNVISALYLQRVLGLSPLAVGLTILPANLMVAVLSLTMSRLAIARLGPVKLLVTGLLTMSAGLLALANAPIHASVLRDVLPAMLLIGAGVGAAYNPLVLCALRNVGPRDTAGASGSYSTVYTFGGVLGFAFSGSLAGSRADALLALGADSAVALFESYQFAFGICAAYAIMAVAIGCFIGVPGPAFKEREVV